MKTEILYGIHPVYEALRAGRREVFDVYLGQERPSGRLAGLLALAESIPLPVHRVKPEKLSALAGSDTHQGIGIRVGPLPLVDIEMILSRSLRPLVILLDGVIDPQNFGAVVRTALCAGADGMIVAKDRAAPLSPAAAKASAGGLEHLPLARVTNLVSTMAALKTAGLWITGLDRAAVSSVYETDLAGAVGIVIGSEHKGIRPLVRKHCDTLAAIPQHGPLDSLNASVAAGVVIYEAVRQRRAAGVAPVDPPKGKGA